MKTRFIFFTAAAAVIAGALAFAGSEGGDTQPDPELRQLRKQVSALESRVATLEKQLQKSRPDVQPPPLRVDPPAISPPLSKPESEPGLFGQPIPGAGQRPKIWGEREINGWKFYIIPCAAGSPPATESHRPEVISPK